MSSKVHCGSKETSCGRDVGSMDAGSADCECNCNGCFDARVFGQAGPQTWSDSAVSLAVENAQLRTDLARVTEERDAALLKIKIREFKDAAAVLGVRTAEHMFQVSREESVALGVRPAHTLKKE